MARRCSARSATSAGFDGGPVDDSGLCHSVRMTGLPRRDAAIQPLRSTFCRPLLALSRQNAVFAGWDSRSRQVAGELADPRDEPVEECIGIDVNTDERVGFSA